MGWVQELGLGRERGVASVPTPGYQDNGLLEYDEDSENDELLFLPNKKPN